jgi:mono/diheme cytochrome c family protein
VIDRAGHETWRKMETRLIVSRPDVTLPDGTAKQTALFGTYVWSDDETSATLANLPYRDGTPFADQVRTYITDELAYQDVVDSVGPGADFEAGLQEALARALERNPKLQQHYAIPGRIRCMQCHQGSPTKDFVLGFFPLQVARRATGTGGTYDPTGEDELSQLQRLIDYGVIKGMTSPADVVHLEDSQGTRKPRTDGELVAQAYMIGNCAHCHNPRGLPSVTKPELANALNFLPDGKDGGVFEFPFERMSPVRQRGAGGDVPIPYITPSLRDYPVANVEDTRMDNGLSLNTGLPGVEITWTPKYPQGIEARNCEDLPKQTSDHARALLRAYCGGKKQGLAFVPAPWRSLIYRNVDSPFPYFDDYVPFPHMPMNTFGFDCRAPRIMGDWMVGLPAERKYPGLPENVIPSADAKRGDGSYDDRPQPYQEVKPDDPRYPMAAAQAQVRLAEYHEGVRYGYCEDVLSPDIFDPVAPVAAGGYQPDPDRYVYGSTPPFDPTRPGEYTQPPLGVPYHSHFFPYDPTDPPPPWSPRRPDWNAVLVDRVTDLSPPAGGVVLTDELKHQRKVLVDAINEAELNDALRTYATTEIPYGLWEKRPGCDKLAAQPKAGDFTGSARPAWMNKVKPPGDAPVYMAAPGAIIYAHVCVNCHGPNADGKGLQADALAASSEGEARPANFREGLFGPSTGPGANLLEAFGMGQADVASRWAPRYMAWMALGGTLKRIPQDIIHQVEATKVFGQQRPNLHHLLGAEAASANMLKLAAGLCAIMLPDKNSGHYYDYAAFENGSEPQFYPPFNANDTPFLDMVADRDMWMHLCTQYSPVVVRVYGVSGFAPPGDGIPAKGDVGIVALYYGDSYPTDAPVLDQNRVIQTGIQPDISKPNANLYPACFQPPSDPQAAAWVAGTAIKTKFHMPDCPKAFLDVNAQNQSKVMWTLRGETDAMKDNIARWSLRGGIATGMSVFSYLRSGGAQGQLKPYYNQCQLLK